MARRYEIIEYDNGYNVHLYEDERLVSKKVYKSVEDILMLEAIGEIIHSRKIYINDNKREV